MQRILLIAVAVVVAAGAAAAYVRSEEHHDVFDSSCLVRLSLPVTQLQGTAYFDVNQSVALAELARALRGPLYGLAGQRLGLDANTVASHTGFLSGPRGSFIQLTVDGRNAAEAELRAGTVCGLLRDQLIAQRKAGGDGDVARLGDQLLTLAKRRQGLASPLTNDEFADLKSIDSAIALAQVHLANALAQPSDTIRATAASPATKVPRWSTDTIVRATLGALPLAVFLSIVFTQLANARRSRRGTT